MAENDPNNRMMEAIGNLAAVNPVARLVLSGEADVGDVVEAAGAITAVATVEAEGLRVSHITQMCKKVKKHWRKYSESLGNLMLAVKQEVEGRDAN